MVDRAALNRELKKIRHMIETRPEIKARFDRDGNGVIDGDEWEAVRQLAIRRLERKAAEEAAARAEATMEAGAAPAEAEPAVAERIVQEDLAPAGPDAGDLTVQNELVVEQEGALGQVFEQMSLRRYAVRSRSGRALATLHQQQNEALQNLANRSPLDVPVLTFSLGAVGQPPLRLERHYIGMGMRIDVADPGGGILAHCQQKTGLLRPKLLVSGALDGHPLTVVKPLLRPFSYDIVDAFDEKVGTVERRWSGLGGFLSCANLTRISLRADQGTPGRRLGLIAAALMIDLSEENMRER